MLVATCLNPQEVVLKRISEKRCPEHFAAGITARYCRAGEATVLRGKKELNASEFPDG